jgi:hypothetical protein
MLHDTLMLTLFAQVLALPFTLLTIFLAFSLALLTLFLITFESPTKLLSPECLILIQPGDQVCQMDFFTRPFTILLKADATATAR